MEFEVSYSNYEISYKDMYVFLDIIIEGDATSGTPDVYYLPNGDPGYPGDPGEFEITGIQIEEIRFENEDGEVINYEPSEQEIKEIEKIILKDDHLVDYCSDKIDYDDT